MIYEAITVVIFSVIGYVVRLPDLANDINMTAVLDIHEQSKCTSLDSTKSRMIGWFEKYMKNFDKVNHSSFPSREICLHFCRF